MDSATLGITIGIIGVVLTLIGIIVGVPEVRRWLLEAGRKSQQKVQSWLPSIRAGILKVQRWLQKAGSRLGFARAEVRVDGYSRDWYNVNQNYYNELERNGAVVDFTSESAPDPYRGSLLHPERPKSPNILNILSDVPEELPPIGDLEPGTSGAKDKRAYRYKFDLLLKNTGKTTLPDSRLEVEILSTEQGQPDRTRKRVQWKIEDGSTIIPLSSQDIPQDRQQINLYPGDKVSISPVSAVSISPTPSFQIKWTLNIMGRQPLLGTINLADKEQRKEKIPIEREF